MFSPNCKNILKLNDIICSSCSLETAFVFQISCPVDSSENDRILYFFICVNPQCKNPQSFLFRIISKCEQSKQSDSKLFDDGWDEPNEQVKEICQTFEKNVCITEDQEMNNRCNYFKPHYISVFEEPGEIKLNKREMEIFENQAKYIGKDESVNDSYEKSFPIGFKDDKDNYRFYKRLKRCPQQIIRYEWNGHALNARTDAKLSPNRCQNCGESRIFELQIMPYLINFSSQNTQDTSQNVKLDFETIIVFTCSKNCTDIDRNIFKEETILFKESFNDIVQN